MRRMTGNPRGIWARVWRLPSRALRAVALAALALLIVFEEWGWEPLQRALARLARWPPLHRVEGGVAALPPAGALAVFVLPTLLLLPAKLAALWLIARGHALLGLGAVAAAKVVGTALVARLFTLTRPALLQLGWFARAYRRWMRWKGALLARLRASALWRFARRLRRALRARWARWRATHFGA